MDLQAEARAEGLAEGRAEGRAEAHVEVLGHRVRLKYGDEAVVDKAMPPLYIDDLPRSRSCSGRRIERAENRAAPRAA